MSDPLPRPRDPRAFQHRPPPPAELPEAAAPTPPRGIPTVSPPPPPEKPKRGAPPRSPYQLPLWSVLLTVMLSCALVACAVAAVVALGGRTPPAAPPQFVIWTAAATETLPQRDLTILATPTLALVLSGSSDSGLVLAGPTLPPIIFTDTPTPRPRITIGSQVQVIGGRGINIRLGPGTNNGVVRVADPGEFFAVVDGPRSENGLTWWQITDDRGITGWAAQNDGTTDLFEVIAP